MKLTEQEALNTARVLRSWLTRCRIALKAYNNATTRTVAAERRLGVPAVVLSALVATGVFATLESHPDVGWRIATGIVAALAAVLTALQTFLRQAERAEQFREAARGYGRMRREIERVQLLPPTTREDADEVLASLAAELADTSRGKPNVPQSIWDRAEYLVKGTCDARGWRALRLWMQDHFHFGIADSAGPLPEDHERYFDTKNARIVPIDQVLPSVTAEDEPAAVAEAKRRMRRAAAGRLARRSPISVRNPQDDLYVILDGNATFAVAEQEAWETVPIRVVVTTDSGGGGDAASD